MLPGEVATVATIPTSVAVATTAAETDCTIELASEQSESDEDEEQSATEERYVIELEGLEPLEPGAEPRRGVSKLGIGKKSWTTAEDDILADVVAKHGAHRWSSVASYLPGRAGKQCRERCASPSAVAGLFL